jgi:TonB-dependent SusC/RagA subfamily outer membrane receptor
VSNRHRLSRAAAGALLLSMAALPACARRGPSTTVVEAPLIESDTLAPNVKTTGRSLEDLFAGKFPGVSVSRADNGGLHIRIRGGSNSFMGSDEPLFVVDGSPLPAGTGGIVHIAPSDIDRIEVLKNPADVAMYGVRGGNGVVSITTKRPGRR